MGNNSGWRKLLYDIVFCPIWYSRCNDCEKCCEECQHCKSFNNEDGVHEKEI